jgi:hypothetical protein
MDTCVPRQPPIPWLLVLVLDVTEEEGEKMLLTLDPLAATSKQTS